MEQSEQQTKLEKNSPTTSGQESLVTMNVINQVFTKMAVMYGAAWINQLKGREWTNILKNEWLNSLRSVQVQQISLALTNLEKGVYHAYRTFPPNLIEFRQICAGQPKVQVKRVSHESKSARVDWRDRIVNEIMELHGEKYQEEIKEAILSGRPLKFLFALELPSIKEILERYKD